MAPPLDSSDSPRSISADPCQQKTHINVPDKEMTKAVNVSAVSGTASDDQAAQFPTTQGPPPPVNVHEPRPHGGRTATAGPTAGAATYSRHSTNGRTSPPFRTPRDHLRDASSNSGRPAQPFGFHIDASEHGFASADPSPHSSPAINFQGPPRMGTHVPGPVEVYAQFTSTPGNVNLPAEMHGLTPVHFINGAGISAESDHSAMQDQSSHHYPQGAVPVYGTYTGAVPNAGFYPAGSTAVIAQPSPGQTATYYAIQMPVQMQPAFFPQGAPYGTMQYTGQNPSPRHIHNHNGSGRVGMVPGSGGPAMGGGGHNRTGGGGGGGGGNGYHTGGGAAPGNSNMAQYHAMVGYFPGMSINMHQQDTAGHTHRMGGHTLAPNFPLNAAALAPGQERNRRPARSTVRNSPANGSMFNLLSELNAADPHGAADYASAATASATMGPLSRPTDALPELLEDYRCYISEGGTGLMPGMSLSSMGGNVVAFSRDQVGSRAVQLALAVAPPEDISDAFHELQPVLKELMVDVFANYVVQRFLETGGDDVQSSVTNALKGRVLRFSLHIYGCRVVQKALEILPEPTRVVIASELKRHTLRCIADQHANHVVQVCLQRIQPTEGPVLKMAEDIAKHVLPLAQHSYGCRLVQRLLQHCTVEEVTTGVVDELVAAVEELSRHEYGNYVIQHLVVDGPDDAREAVFAHVTPHAQLLSCHKYASNLIEKCLLHGASRHRSAIIRALIQENDTGYSIGTVAKDRFGNYVLQQALDVASNEETELFVEGLKPHLEELRKSPFGKHIAANITKLMRSSGIGVYGGLVDEVA